MWAKIVAWNSDNVPRTQREASREMVEGLLKARPNGAALLKQFDALADRELEAAE